MELSLKSGWAGAEYMQTWAYPGTAGKPSGSTKLPEGHCSDGNCVGNRRGAVYIREVMMDSGGGGGGGYLSYERCLRV